MFWACPDWSRIRLFAIAICAHITPLFQFSLYRVDAWEVSEVLYFHKKFLSLAATLQGPVIHKRRQNLSGDDEKFQTRIAPGGYGEWRHNSHNEALFHTNKYWAIPWTQERRYLVMKKGVSSILSLLQQRMITWGDSWGQESRPLEHCIVSNF